MRKRLEQEILPRNEIRIEDGHEFAPGGHQPFLQGTGLVPFPVGAVNVLDVKSHFPVPLHIVRDDAECFICGIVQQLDLQLLFGIDHCA